MRHTLGRSNGLAYVASTGYLFGGNEVPHDIVQQINAYNNGELSELQVREYYLGVLGQYKKNEPQIEQQTSQLSLFEQNDNDIDNELATLFEIRESNTIVSDELNINSLASDDTASTAIMNSEEQNEYPTTGNFRITDDRLGEGGAKTKYRYNIEAITLLKEIEEKNRSATSGEQEILSRYVGWGGLPQAFDPENEQWEREYHELKGELSEREYDMARASTLNAHYTSPVVIKAMYETLERLGFKDGNLIEPACGIGNFFGLLPESMQKANLYGVELDSITGRIAKQLYPNADIKVMGFEKSDTPDSFFDAAIGNVPFGAYKVNDPRYNRNDFFIHDYFLQKPLTKCAQEVS